MPEFAAPQRPTHTSVDHHSVLRVQRPPAPLGPGRPLDGNVRIDMETRFGHDFSQVRVHSDEESAATTRAYGALAYTTGPDIVFGPGQYRPGTASGRRLLTHELAHVVQQAGRPSAVPAGDVSAPGDAAERAADVAAHVFGRREAPDRSLALDLRDTLRATCIYRPMVQRAEAPPAAVATAAKSDADIDALDLSATIKKAAQELRKKYPEVVFTSGRRNTHEQAHAMASNIVSSGNRKWISNTYLAGKKLQDWVDAHKDKKTVDELTVGLEETLNGMSDAERGGVSKHLSGDAFDVQPVTKDADKIKADIKALPGLSKFLESEGGLVRWHAQF